MNETWKAIEGWEGFYEVSSFGRVKKLARTREDSKGRKYEVKETIKKKRIDNVGYPIVDLVGKGAAKRMRIHRLVAKAFLPNPCHYEYVNHKDLDKTNNHVDNLEWCTPKHNMVDAFNKGAFDGCCQAVRIVETGATYKSLHQCAIAINGCVQNVSACLIGKRKSYKGYHFERI